MKVDNGATGELLFYRTEDATIPRCEGILSAAVEALNSALDLARRRKAGLEYEPRMLADLANAYRLKGDFAAAVRTADEAIEVATTWHTSSQQLQRR